MNWTGPGCCIDYSATGFGRITCYNFATSTYLPVSTGLSDFIIGSNMAGDGVHKLQVVGNLTGTLGAGVLRLTSMVATGDYPQFAVRQYRLTTTDAFTATLGTIAIAASKTYLLEARVLARRTDGTSNDGAVYIRRCMVTTRNGAVTINAVQDALTQEDQTVWNCTFELETPPGTNVLLRVLGAASNTVTWHATLFIQEVGS